MTALAGMVSAIGRPSFGVDALEALNRMLQVGSWSVYRLWPDRPPVMYTSASRGVADTTDECFSIYRDAGLYRRDRTFDLVDRQRPGHSVLLRLHADDVPNRDHREAIYRRHGMLERLSLAWRLEDRSLLAVNLYRHAHQGLFGGDEVQRVADAVPMLQAAVARHVDWLAEPVSPDPPDPRTALAERCPALTERELDVLSLLMAGMTYDGIAAQLGLALGTVKTYRARAFARLDIHFRSQLFMLARRPAS